MPGIYETQFNRENRKFLTTAWTEINCIDQSDKAHQSVLLGNLLQKYWKPIYCYLRSKGNATEQAKDLTQGFIQEILLGRDLLKQADREKGKFRTFLLTALDRFIVSKHRYETAQKRHPAEKLIPLGDLEITELPEPDNSRTPDQAFHHAWVSQLLEEVLAEVKESCQSRDKQVHWNVFHDRVIAPILNATPPLSIPDICKKYNINSNAQASNMIVTVKRRFQTILVRHVQDLSDTQDDIMQEINSLMKILLNK